MKTYTTILVELSVLKELRRMRGELEAKTGNRVSMGNAVKFLISQYNGKENV